MAKAMALQMVRREAGAPRQPLPPLDGFEITGGLPGLRLPPGPDGSGGSPTEGLEPVGLGCGAGGSCGGIVAAGPGGGDHLAVSAARAMEYSLVSTLSPLEDRMQGALAPATIAASSQPASLLLVL